MKILEILLEAAKLDFDDLSSLKKVVTSKIKELPEDDATARALKEIQDLLAHIHSGGKAGIINDKLKQIPDPTVASAHKEISRYLMSIDMTPENRDDLFSLWKSDKLINKAKLLTPGKHSFDEIVKNYDSNPAIEEFVNDMMRIAALGQGKGEFGLSVLSKDINKPQKGDLEINGRKIEVKTTDGGAGRFTDQEVRPAEGFEAAARELNAFILKEKFFQSLPKSGLSLGNALVVYDHLGDDRDKSKQGKYLTLLTRVISLIFGGSKANRSDINAIIKGVKNNNLGEAMQAYSKASFNYYMGMKDDEGVLYIDLTTTPISTIFFRDADDLANSGVRFHAGTVYLTSINDPRLPYPQMQIVVTKSGSAGSNVKGSAEPDIKKGTVSKTASYSKGPTRTMLSPKEAPKAKTRAKR